MRVLLDRPPFHGPAKNRWERGWWPALWLEPETPPVLGPQVWAWRRRFTLDAATRIRLHVSADERYELYLDGERIGCGPERGDRQVWYFESHDLDLVAGEHLLTARTWWLGPDAPAPYAQVSLRPAFLLAAENVDKALLNTGHAPWEAQRIDGYSLIPPGMTWATGVKVEIDGSRYPWGWELGGGGGWTQPKPICTAGNESESVDHDLRWWLRPAELPAMRNERWSGGRVRHLEPIASLDTGDLRVESSRHVPVEAVAWEALLAGRADVVIPPRTRRRAIIDLDGYACAYPTLVVSGGAGSEVRVNWAESLFEAPRQEHGAKGQRDQIEGKWYWGTGNRFHPDGGARRLFEGLWWQSGRFIEVLIETGDAQLTVHELTLRETGYPLARASSFVCADPRHGALDPLLWRTMTACSHETFVDCPYYEQLQYVADCRVEALITYATANDPTLARKAIATFDRSRMHSGLIESRAPHSKRQILSTFSLWWVGMVHDYAMWVDDLGFVRERMRTLRGILDHFLAHVDARGLLIAPLGWSFIDWCPEWLDAVPPDGEQGECSGVLCWLLVWSLRQAADLENVLGEPELSQRWQRRASELAAATDAAFWDEGRGLYADTLRHGEFSEHAQVLALLSGAAPAARRARMISGLAGVRSDGGASLTRATWYFTHYLGEALAMSGRVDVLLARLEAWFGLPAQGFLTIPERPEPSRSDCHAWSAHPLYHQLASILGVRPSSPGFATVRIRPQLGGLAKASGRIPHRLGEIVVDVARDDSGKPGGMRGEVVLPAGLSGTLELGDEVITLESGRTPFSSLGT